LHTQLMIQSTAVGWAATLTHAPPHPSRPVSRELGRHTHTRTLQCTHGALCSCKAHAMHEPCAAYAMHEPWDAHAMHEPCDAYAVHELWATWQALLRGSAHLQCGPSWWTPLPHSEPHNLTLV